MSKPILASYVQVNTFLDEHNHALLPDTAIFSTEFRVYLTEMKDDIEYFVSCGISDIYTIRSLIDPKNDTKYLKAENFLTNTLLKTKESSAHCYIRKIFTNGMQSTQRVEGLNAIINKEIESSMSLTVAYEKHLKD